jgi:superfamily II DNA or RNA helicase
VTSPVPIEDLAPEVVAAIRADADGFPPDIQRRGLACLGEGRVGPLDIRPSRVSATVRGTRSYRTFWNWNGQFADPGCTCPAAPICKHAYALARAIQIARNAPDLGADGVARASRRVPETRRRPFYGDDFPPPESTAARASDDLASEFVDWARHHAETPTHTLRAVFGLDHDALERPGLWLEARLTNARLHDAPRSAHQIAQLASELHRNPLLLAPPHTRLLRVLAAAVPLAEPLGNGTRFGLGASTINRLLDSFSDSGLATWTVSPDRAVETRGEVAAGDRLRLGDAAVDIVPICSGEGADMRVLLAARWPEGRQRNLQEVVYIPSDDELHPSLVLSDGAFWRVAEEPPPQLIRRLTQSAGLLVPEIGRGRFLELLAASFTNVADALGPHMRMHPARPAVTLDLEDDDWLRIRLFAHTGDDAWRPGLNLPGVIAFELLEGSRWVKVDADARAVERDTAREPVGRADAGVAPVMTAERDDSISSGTDLESPIWVELPDPAPLESVRAWLGTLPTARRIRREAEVGLATAPPADRGLGIRLGARNLELFAEAWERRPGGVLFLGNPRLRDLLGNPGSVRPRVTVVASGLDWFTVSAEWQAEGRALTEDDLAKLRSARTRYVKLAAGWVRREQVHEYDAAAEQLADLGIEVGAGDQRLTLAQLAQARPEHLAILESLGGDPRTTAEIERLRESVRSFTALPKIPVPAGLIGTLRPYQRDGLDFLAFVTGLGLGAVLADDMGLGKTIQALAWIEWLREREPDGGPVLVVCPASVVHNWQREAERFTPHLRVLALTSGEERLALRRTVPEHDIVITNYALLRRDLAYWRSVPLRAAILDEAQMIKNPGAAVSRAVLELNARHRLALTGTPIENRALDLWSIMQFVNPGYLGRRSAFAARYDRRDGPPHMRRLLAARLRPVMVRRLKEDVAPDLPDRIEERRECELTPGQRKLYLAELVRGRATVQRLEASPEGVQRNKIEILALLTRLRQVCCHPALVGGRERLGSGKFDALFELLEPLLAEGRKVLVFSQFVECLKLLAAEMRRRAIGHHLLTGATTRREAVVAAFENDPEPCVFLISLKAGGTGLNLTAASYVVLFDPWWNPAVEAQAIDRAHRIGQTRTVIAYRMLAAGTIEEKIWELQQRKAALVEEVLGEDGFARSLTQKDLDYLLV